MRTRTNSNVMRDFNAWANTMNRVLENARYPYDYARNGGSNGHENGDKRASLPLDVWATDEAFQIEAYLPGVDPENVEITVEGDELTIRSQLPQVDDDRKYVRRELFRGAFERKLSFNVPVNVDAIEASFKYGLLSLTIPKAEVILPKQIKVQTA